MNTISSSVTLGLQSSFLNTRPVSKVSNNQQMAIEAVLKDFNPEKLSSADAKKITADFKKLGIEPGPALEAAMASMGFDARKVGELAFGRSQQTNNNNGQGKAAAAIQSALAEFKDLMSSATESAGSEKEAKAAADSFLNTLFAAIKSQEDATKVPARAKNVAETTNTEIESGRAQRAGMSEGKMVRPDGPPPNGVPQNGSGGSAKSAYSDSATAIADYLKQLIAEFNAETTSSTSATSSTNSTASTGSFSGVVSSANNLFAKNGIAATSSTLTDFLQILQSKMEENATTTGNVIDAQV